jgi:hypothetical protein
MSNDFLNNQSDVKGSMFGAPATREPRVGECRHVVERRSSKNGDVGRRARIRSNDSHAKVESIPPSRILLASEHPNGALTVSHSISRLRERLGHVGIAPFLRRQDRPPLFRGLKLHRVRRADRGANTAVVFVRRNLS